MKPQMNVKVKEQTDEGFVKKGRGDEGRRRDKKVGFDVLIRGGEDEEMK